MESLFRVTDGNVSNLDDVDFQLYELSLHYLNQENSLNAIKKKLQINAETPQYLVAINVIKNMSRVLFLMQNKVKRCIAKHRELINAVSNRINICERIPKRKKVKKSSIFSFTNFQQSFYFKYSVPCEKNNADVKSIRESGYMYMTDKIPLKRWNENSKNLLYSSVRKSIIFEQSEQLLLKLHRVHESTKMTADERKIEALRKICEKLTNKMKNLKLLSLTDLLMRRRSLEINWALVTQIANHRFTEQECETVWNLVANPLINNGPWLEEEALLLKCLADEFEYQDWETINTKLNCERTSFLCFVYYQNNFKKSLRKSPKMWTENENSVIRNHLSTSVSFAKLLEEFGVNTRQLKQHVSYLNLNKETVKGKYSRKEKFLMKFYAEKGFSASKIAQTIGRRTEKQVKDFENYVRTKTGNGRWGYLELCKLLQAIKYNGIGKWTNVSKYMLGRNALECRMKYKHLKSKKKEFVRKYLGKKACMMDAKLLVKRRKKYEAIKSSKKNCFIDDKIEAYFIERMDNVGTVKFNEHYLAESTLLLMKFLLFDVEMQNQYLGMIGNWLKNFASYSEEKFEFDRLFDNLGLIRKNLALSAKSKFSQLSYKNWKLFPPNKCCIYGLNNFRNNYEEICRARNTNFEKLWVNINSSCKSRAFVEDKLLWYAVLQTFFYWPLKMNATSLIELV